MLCNFRPSNRHHLMNSLVVMPALNSELIIPALLLAAFVLLITAISLTRRQETKCKELQDINDDKAASREVKISRLKQENELLVTELHHRVKNNLQIVTSLLHSQSAYLKDDAAISAIMDSQHRIQAMSLIHKKLYQRERYSTVFMPEYIDELVSYLMESFKSTSNVSCDLQIADIRLQMVLAVPVGLILNEILTNALKYAFPFSDHDCITIRFFNTSPNEICLEVKDNGKGLPDGFSFHHNSAFGLLLMKGLTEELNGVFSIENKEGTLISMSFADTTFFTGDDHPKSIN